MSFSFRTRPAAQLTFSAGERLLPLTIRESPRARTMRLRVDPRTGAVLLTVPRRASRRRALAWADEQRAWVEAALAELPAAVPLQPGAAVPLEGVPHAIEWQQEADRKVVLAEGRIRVGGPREMVGARLLRWLKAEAAATLQRESLEFAAKAGVGIGRVSVGDPLSRWGSCSSDGNLRYSWRLILAPDWVRRATVAHEVAHRVHMDHSRAFHTLVAELLGEDPKPARAWLRTHGPGLHRIGRS
jgi:predicted metal-dependent hydrolase